MKKILQCDDDQDITTLMNIIVESMGYDFVSVNEVRDIEALVINEKPDLVLMDLWIPQIGGEKAIMKLKSNPLTKDVPVYLFSASDKIHEVCEKIKADGCIQKPFDVKDFKKKLSEMLETSSLERQTI